MSCLEVTLILYRLRHADPGLWIRSAGYAVAIFDYTTTAVGLVFTPFRANLGALWPLWTLLAIALVALTFSFEGLLARLLKGR